MCKNSLHINVKMRDVVVACMTGDVEKMKTILAANENNPMPIAQWTGTRRGLDTIGVLDSFQLSCALHDALRINTFYEKNHIGEMWKLHRELMPQIKRTPYSQYDFIIWNSMDEPGDNPYFDEEDQPGLLDSGVPMENILLTNCGIQHMEDDVIRLLKAGASPYFLVTIPSYIEAYIDNNGKLCHTYFDVAPMLEVTKCHSVDYWYDFGLNKLGNDVSKFPVSELECLVEGVFNVAACERILHLTDKYISEKARKEGDEMMMKYLGEIRSIVR